MPVPGPRGLLSALLGPVVVVSLLTGCGPRGGGTHSAAPPVRTAPTSPTLATSPGPTTSGPRVAAPGEASTAEAVTATEARIAVHSGPGGPVTHTFTNPQPSGAPLTFLLNRQDRDWLQVYLPVRPNGSTGWVRTTDVTQASIPYRLEILTAAHQLRLYRANKLLHTYTAATGTGGTPTPLGLFYLTELLAPTNSGYGPYAYGLSAFSNVLTSFGGGPGQIGLHGTADAASIGHSVSHGCIRLTNTDITTLAKLLPLGTPVHIT